LSAGTDLDRAQLEILCDAALAAGREIMAVYRTDFQAWEKDDRSPLTEADLKADAVIRTALEANFSGIFILSEESSSVATPGATAQRFFLVDPLDGTREFLKRNDEFTVNIALVENGEPVAGVVFAPALDELFFAARNVGAWQRVGGRESALGAVTPPTGPLRVIGSRSHGTDAMGEWLARLGPHEFVGAGSSLKFCRLAQGRADLYPRLGPTSQWDTGAAQAVLEQAGGQVLDPTGQPLRYGLDRPVLNTHFIALSRAGMDYPALS
jgi:3'(2'), 5'-bisphosphate nucleotidase